MNSISGMNINVGSAGIPTKLPTAMTLPTASAENEQPFRDLLLDSIGQVNAMQQNADQAVESLVTGGEANMAEVLTAVQKADLSFRMMMQIRNKLVQAFQEIKDIRI